MSGSLTLLGRAVHYKAMNDIEKTTFTDNRIIIDDCKRILKTVDLSLLEGKQVLITGASGLLGTFLLYSIKVYNDVHDIPIYVTTICRRQLPVHLIGLEKDSWLKVIRGDLTDENFLSSLPKYDAIIHAATYGQPGRFLAEQKKTLILNTFVTDRLLARVLEGGYFLFISSSEIYSGSEAIPYTETTCGATMPDHLRACYIEGKRCGEAFCQCYAKDAVIRVKIARVALAYGPGVRADDRRVLYNFIQKGLGQQTVYNVGNIPSSEVSIYEIAKEIGNYLKVPVIRPKTDAGGVSKAPRSVCMDVTRYVREFGKKDFIDLSAGIAKTIDWYKQLFK